MWLPTTGLADTFNTDATNTVNAIAINRDGRILLGGQFTRVSEQNRNIFARLSNDTGALQNLAVTQTAITWTRGGSSPQFSRVIFDSSTNNVNFTSLGDGTPTGDLWTLTGLSLPTAQHIYIRARGYYNGSVQETVRYVFLPPPSPRLNIQRSANTNVVLSWATNFSGFTLESKTNLNTNVWSVVSPTPAISGTNNVVTNPVSVSPRFYRWRK